jgi:molybdopterin-guanine dinucleotide biosynthesis protein A
MGRDKALVPSPDPNLLLWEWQLRTLQDLKPEQLFWSGRARSGVPPNVQVVADAMEKAGPLAGIATSLGAVQSDLLVVLAVDLPQMTTAYLRGLVERCSLSCGVVAQSGKYFEPLAAIYPKEASSLAAEHLEQGRYAMQDFVREAIQRKMLHVLPVTDLESHFFKNLNSPADL